MSQPNNSYAREARRNLRDGQAAQEAARRERLDSMLTDRTTGKANAHKRAEAMAERFDALAVGDTLAAFGMGYLSVAKKNRKSVVTDGGSKWTRFELTGCK